MPYLAAIPVEIKIAIGVANPKAQGHAITKTETARRIESLKSMLKIKYEIMNVIILITITPYAK
jgi:hypothetical protein